MKPYVFSLKSLCKRGLRIHPLGTIIVWLLLVFTESIQSCNTLSEYCGLRPRLFNMLKHLNTFELNTVMSNKTFVLLYKRTEHDMCVWMLFSMCVSISECSWVLFVYTCICTMVVMCAYVLGLINSQDRSAHTHTHTHTYIQCTHYMW